MKIRPDSIPAYALVSPLVAFVGALVGAQPAVAQTLVTSFTNSTQFATGFGYASTNVGDLDGDGTPEIAISSAYGGGGGRVEVRSSSTGAVIWERASAAGSFGAKMVPLGDLNADGTVDLLVSSPDESTSATAAGAIRVLSGTNGAILREWFGNEVLGEMGQELAALGDVNGDGSPDFAFTNFDEPHPALITIGSVTIRSALTGADLVRIVEPNGDYVALGSALANVGDIDGDGVHDLLIGSRANRRTGPELGAADVHSGATGAVLLALDGDEIQARFGDGGGPAGDFNQDGTPDFIVSSTSAQFNGTRSGKAGVYSGTDASLLAEFQGTEPFVEFGGLVGCAGDMDGDGRDEIYCGTRGYVQGNDRPGQVSVFDGDGDLLLQLHPTASFESFGHVYPAGDVDGDGLADLLVGATTASNPSLSTGPGRLDVYTLDPRSGGVLCAGLPNSTGSRSFLDALSPSDYLSSANDLTLRVTSLPQGVMGYFLVSQGAGIDLFAGTSEGRLCVAASEFGRYSRFVLSSGTTGEVALSPDTTSIPLATAAGVTFKAAQPGDTFNFQFWHRDLRPDGSLTNTFSDAVTITFQ